MNINHYLSPITEIYSIFLAIVGFMSGLFLWFNRRTDENLHLNRLLAVILSLSSFHFLRNYLIATEWIIEFPWMFGSFSFVYLLAPAVTYLYIRGLLNDESQMQRNDWLHYIPAALQLIASLPYISSSHQSKVEIVKQISHMNNLLFNNNPFNGISYSVLFVMVFLSVVIYGVLMFRTLQTKKQSHTSEHFEKVYSWSRWVTWIMLYMALFMLINVIISSSNIANTANFIYLGPFYAIRLILFSLLLYRILLSSRIRLGLPNLNTNRQLIELSLSNNIQVTEGQSPNDPESKSTTELFADLLDQFFKTQQDKYTQQTFNIDHLSEATHIPKHHWAYYFRYHSALSFVEQRNYHRIQYAKSLILDPNYANITLEAIGNTAGFGSRTTFFNAFKKFEGISPSDFLKTIDHSTGSTKF